MDERTIDTGTNVLRAQVRDRMGVITFTRAERRNALHRDMYAPFAAAMEHFAAAPDVGCIVLTGEGPAFCAGGDVRDGRPKGPDGRSLSFDERVAALSADARTAVLLHESPKLTIAAVNGPAVGLGCDIACMADIRIAADSARFGVPFVTLGLIPGDGGAWLLPRVIGASRAAEMLFTGDLIDAATAAEWGLVNKVVPPDQLMAEARRLAARIAAKAPHALRLSKRLIRQGQTMGYDAALELAASTQSLLHLSDDHREGVAALLEKRPAMFLGQ